MRKIKYFNIFYTVLTVFFLNILKCYSLSLNVKNNTESIYSITSISNENADEKEIVFNFVDSYYDLDRYYTSKGESLLLQMSDNQSITFMGSSEKSEFNVGKMKIRIDFLESNNSTGYITFKNIKFIGQSVIMDAKIGIIEITINNDSNVIVNIDNCTFEDFKSTIINTITDLSVKNRFTLNVKNSFFDSYQYSRTISYENCTFNNNINVHYSIRENFIMKNCTLSGSVNSISYSRSIFLFAFESSVIIENTTYENINSNELVPPLMIVSPVYMRINNVVVRNVHSVMRYILKIIGLYRNTEFNSIYVSSSGVNNDITIKNSKFYDISVEIGLPAITDLSRCNVKIISCEISDIVLHGYPLFEETSSYEIVDTTFKNIESSHKAIMISDYANISLNNCKFENITTFGDESDSGIILFYGNEIYNQLSLNNIYIKNVISNGPVIKVIKYNSKVYIKNLNVINSVSYGPFIYISSYSNSYVDFILEDSFFSNIGNINKKSCGGSIALFNNVNSTINNNVFEYNTSQDGGSLCLKNILNMNINIENSKFNNNVADNGGSLYIKEDNGDSKLNFLMKNSIFEKNIAKYYGGAIYTDYSKMYLNKMIDCNFINNTANIGGAIYTPHNKSTGNINNITCIFNNNIGKSYGNEYGSSPSRLKLNDLYDKRNYNTYSGDVMSLDLFLYDEFNNLVIDDKYFLYTDLTIETKLYNKEYVKNDNTIKKKIIKYTEVNKDEYVITGNNCKFNNGKFTFQFKFLYHFGI
ncbi:hypothetical protein PIROE2DRAFT_2406 [Piromyces sp. E2]|nr:hypothetical protein PIROE2DRAFT_2406 [Piromyces sp. E2]|eukprot:OUM69546.1 hypothetical protein PIROE2DRAFT_2406 [Piromyces sp. E2]